MRRTPARAQKRHGGFALLLEKSCLSGSDPLVDIHRNRHSLRMSATRRTQSSFICLAGATALLLSGCANAKQQVAGHRFEVPSVNLVPESDYPFFFPKAHDEGFIFILNPGAELRQRRAVLVQERKTVCARANGGGYVSQTICAPNEVEWQGQRWVKKGDETFWTYSPETPAGSDAPFVSCHKMQIEGQPGLCTAILALGDLVLMIGLDDDELPELEATYKRAASMLRAWEV